MSVASATAIGSGNTSSQPNTGPLPGLQRNAPPLNGSLLSPAPPTTIRRGPKQTTVPAAGAGGRAPGGIVLHSWSVTSPAATRRARARSRFGTRNVAVWSVHVAGTATSPISWPLPATPEKASSETGNRSSTPWAVAAAFTSPIPQRTSTTRFPASRPRWYVRSPVAIVSVTSVAARSGWSSAGNAEKIATDGRRHASVRAAQNGSGGGAAACSVPARNAVARIPQCQRIALSWRGAAGGATPAATQGVGRARPGEARRNARRDGSRRAAPRSPPGRGSRPSGGRLRGVHRDAGRDAAAEGVERHGVLRVLHDVVVRLAAWLAVRDVRPRVALRDPVLRQVRHRKRAVVRGRRRARRVDARRRLRRSVDGVLPLLGSRRPRAARRLRRLRGGLLPLRLAALHRVLPPSPPPMSGTVAASGARHVPPRDAPGRPGITRGRRQCRDGRRARERLARRMASAPERDAPRSRSRRARCRSEAPRP